MQIENQFLKPEEYQEGGYGEDSFNIRELKVGSGDFVQFTDKDGTRWGGESFDTAKAWVKTDGTYSFKDVDGNDVLDSVDGVNGEFLTNATSIYGWSSTVYFQAVDNNTVNWGAGNLKLADGTTYSIVAGSTGNISAPTWVYLDTAVSSTVLQTTTSYIAGLTKILVAAVEESPTGKLAQYRSFGGDGSLGVMITENSVVAESFTGNVFIANTITSREVTTGELITLSAQIKNAIITNAKIADLNVDKLTGTNIIGKNIVGGIFYSANYLGKIYTDASGDIYIDGKDDVVLVAGGSSRAQFTSGSLKPITNNAYDLGTDPGASGQAFRKAFAITFYGGSNGTAGENQSGYGFVNGIRWNGSTLQQRYSEIEVSGGIVTGFNEGSYSDV